MLSLTLAGLVGLQPFRSFPWCQDSWRGADVKRSRAWCTPELQDFLSLFQRVLGLRHDYSPGGDRLFALPPAR